MIFEIAPTCLELTERERNAAQVPTQREADSMLGLFQPGEVFAVTEFKDALGGVRQATARKFILDAHRRGIVVQTEDGRWMRPERKDVRR